MYWGYSSLCPLGMVLYALAFLCVCRARRGRPGPAAEAAGPDVRSWRVAVGVPDAPEPVAFPPADPRGQASALPGGGPICGPNGPVGPVTGPPGDGVRGCP